MLEDDVPLVQLKRSSSIRLEFVKRIFHIHMKELQKCPSYLMFMSPFFPIFPNQCHWYHAPFHLERDSSALQMICNHQTSLRNIQLLIHSLSNWEHHILQAHCLDCSKFGVPLCLMENSNLDGELYRKKKKNHDHSVESKGFLCLKLGHIQQTFREQTKVKEIIFHQGKARTIFKDL